MKKFSCGHVTTSSIIRKHHYIRDYQCSKIPTDHVPSTHGVLLEGEWTWCASSEVRDPKGDANASDTATEHVDHPSKSRVTEDTNGVKSEGHRKGMSE